MIDTPTRTRPVRRTLGSAAAAAALTAGLLGASAVHAPQARAAACTGTTGVTVVVDFTAVGGGIQTGCALGDPASGLAAITGAGFSYSFHPRFPGFVCKINSLPTTCTNPTGSAYWSYWHAPHGGPWSYSSLGAGSYDPAPGEVEGWSFGAGAQPGITAP
ncbi:flagellar hook-length control protein FliK [Streptomyces sp. BE20]|uniref:flagellar hook-length control protein FliK n=1 Tax=unclassified Streptomyces TaxID=2593676 RepID=UPI002E7706DF|nr:MULTISPECIES: flagellar hook-length control protein FliK [unclassified Streptomyces]MED7949270.1 flagellar hook-length control protein FliK [Streptomyces sp. BE303]MEE1826299.1 flagellar hook-length control protein FliK [Streptomyces sp. BE20]